MPSKLPKNEHLASICILRLSAIGDVCNAVAAVQAIQAKHPQAKLTWVIGKLEYQLLKGLPNIEFVVFDKRAGKQGLKAFKAQMADKCFDALLLMQVALRANLVSRYIKAKRRIGFDKQRSKELHSLFINERIAPQAHAHVLQGFMGFAKQLGVDGQPEQQPRWNIPISEAEQIFAEQNIGAPEKTIMIVANASKAERNWLPERYAQVADAAHALGYQVILCGGPSDSELSTAQSICEHSQRGITNLVGKTSLKQLYALLSRTRLLIAPDTGPVHMAVSLGKPVIGLYGHSNPARTGPYLYQEQVVEVYHQHLKQQYGKSVEELPWGKRVKGEHVMADIAVEDVIAKMQALLD